MRTKIKKTLAKMAIRRPSMGVRMRGVVMMRARMGLRTRGK